MSDDERSPGGSPIYRHQQAAPSTGEVGHADDRRISDHLDRVHGGEHNVFHEIVSDRVHVDVHVLAPTAERPFWLLCTAGMSAHPMNVPPGVENADEWRHAEVAMFLPTNWSPSREAFEDERVYWPIRLLKGLARLPHEYSTWLGWGHSIPNGDPAAPYAPGTLLSGAVLIPPFAFEDLFVVPGTPTLHVFQVLPVTQAEMQLKLERALEGMLDVMEQRVPDLYGPVDPARASAV
ncbi:MAG: suppressor of fused domain protein [Sandaracinaceae bacterium]